MTRHTAPSLRSVRNNSDNLDNVEYKKVLDEGGNIGMWSLVAAAANHVTYTFEPYKENYIRICKSITKNDSFDDRIHLFNVAATTEETTFRIDVPNRNKGGGRVAVIEKDENESENQNINNDATKEDEDSIVKGVTIDSLNLPMLTKTNGACDMINRQD